MLSLSSHLIQLVQSLLQIVQRCIFWVGPNPQVFSPGSYLTLLIFPRAILNSFQSWHKNELSSVICSSLRFFEFFSSIGSTFPLFILFSSSMEPSQDCGSYPFSSFQIPFLTGAPLYHSTSRYLFFRSAQDISKIHVSTLLSFKIFRGCHLIQAF